MLPLNRWLKIAILVAVPCILYLLIAERMSWLRPEILATTGGEVYTLAFSPDGKLLASSAMQHTSQKGPSNTVQIWDVKSRKVVTTLKQNQVRGEVFFLPGGNVLACADIRNSNGSMKLYDVKTGKLLRTLVPGSHMFSLSHDGKTLASQSENEWNTINLWDFKTMRRRKILRDTDWVYDTAFSPDGRLLASIIFDVQGDSLNLWDARTGRKVRTLPESDIYLDHITFSPDGQYLACVGNSVTRIWDVNTTKPPRVFSEAAQSATAIAFSPDNSLLAVGTGNNTIHLWSAKTGKLLRTMPMPMPKSPDGAVIALAFSPDGATLACGGTEGQINLWRLK